MGSTVKTHQTDVLICGSGSAGLMAALWLSKYGVPFRVLERRGGPLVEGQADGVQSRTIEILESFGLSHQVIQESCPRTEMTLWASDRGTALSGDEGGGIKRSCHMADTIPGLSPHPMVALNQARVNGLIIGEMLRCGGPEIDYGYEVKHVDVEGAEAYPVTVTAVKDGVEEVFRAKYALGCDGAHSAVRRALGFKMIGDSTDSIWGVMDVYARTTFPDIRKLSIIQSVGGSLMVIPREVESLVRFYIELPRDTIASKVTLEDLHERAKLVFRPYEMEIPATVWWSAYTIGQRLADNFHEQYRVFLTGDACHTHSPKAGQGMNLSLQDGYNIGWKLGAHLSGQASVELVETYVSERQKTAAELIEFDRHYSSLFKSKAGAQNGDHAAVSWADRFRDQFIKSSRYTAGQAYKYGRSVIVSPAQEEKATNGVATSKEKTGLVVGMRFPTAQVVRHSDARVFQLLSLLKSDCRWRIVVFAGDIQQEGVMSSLEKVAQSIESTVQAFTPEGVDQDSTIESLLVLKTKRTELEVHQIPEVFKPVTGEHRIRRLHNVFADDDSYESGPGHAFDTLGIDTTTITIAVVRPDQYVSLVLPGHEVESLGSFFKSFMAVRR